jgi:hypothetical protein
MPDLFHDLEIHGAPIRLRYCEHIVHINIHSMHDSTSRRKPREIATEAAATNAPKPSTRSVFGDKTNQPAIKDLATQSRAL